MIDNRVRKIVTAGVFSALVIVLGITNLGFIPLPGASLTIFHVPVIIAAILEGPVVGLFVGLLFGVFSLVQAAMAAVSLVDLAFLQYPWIAIVPRILIGPVAWLVYSLISGAFFGKAKNNGGISPIQETRVLRETPGIFFGAALGSLVNTALVLSGFAALLPDFTLPMALAVAAINGPLEAGFAIGISLAVILPWKGISRQGRSKLNKNGQQ